MEEKNTFPCISEKNWWTLRKQFKKSVPSEITLDYLRSLLELQDTTSAKNNVMLPLKQIGFVDDVNKPTDRIYDWRDDSKYADTCQHILKDIYPADLLSLFPDSSVDKTKVANFISSRSRVGQSAAGKSAAFFALLKNAEIKTDTDKKKTVKKVNSSKIDSKETSNGDAKENSAKVSAPVQKPSNQASLHIDLQIHISPDASAEQIDKIFESMAKHLYKD